MIAGKDFLMGIMGIKNFSNVEQVVGQWGRGPNAAGQPVKKIKMEVSKRVKGDLDVNLE
ncbi:unnamed protein product [Sphenostylis stenocarpa]|uniref:Uncharacterized protein n=1 Tax=Sphenostylis stenocarpa TaxID=92480 RepID=A0AA86VCL5_9FABA|nr:unnamed protein product [Sphenostylis stenocarpa]